jgi:hypothetical protein
MPRRRDDDEYEWAYMPDLYGHPIPIGHIRRLVLKLVLQALLALADLFDALFTQSNTRDTAR